MARPRGSKSAKTYNAKFWSKTLGDIAEELRNSALPDEPSKSDVEKFRAARDTAQTIARVAAAASKYLDTQEDHDLLVSLEKKQKRLYEESGLAQETLKRETGLSRVGN